ncbi:MAG: trypsin-like peptidase domain-containing protein, partial [Chloroflexi bacterium]|nr:trypsin-like peptidase domain-containing protein [Chloroflexota bacterium]
MQIQTGVGSGSGFIFNVEGWVLTNAHVVGSYSAVTVLLEGIYEQEGEVVGVDEVMDLAVIRLDSSRGAYDTIPLGDSADTEVGDDVIAIGFPLGSILIGSATVTKGVISSRRYSEN